MKADIFTSSFEFIEVARKQFSIRAIFCEKQKLTPELFDYCRWNDFQIIEVDELFAITIAQKNSTDVDLGLSFGFGLIFSLHQLNYYPNGIWNVHTGKLPEFRGRHPITHAFLEDKKEIVVTVHQLDQFIDQGYLIAEAKVRRTFIDNEKTIFQKVLELLESELLYKAIQNFKTGKLQKIQFKTYRLNFTDGIQIATTELVSCNFLYNAVQSQFSHGGVYIDGVRYIKCHYYSKSIVYALPWKLVKCSDGEMMIYPRDSASLP